MEIWTLNWDKGMEWKFVKKLFGMEKLKIQDGVNFYQNVLVWIKGKEQKIPLMNLKTTMKLLKNCF